MEQRQRRDDFRDGGWGCSLWTWKAPQWHSNEGLPELEGKDGRENWREIERERERERERVQSQPHTYLMHKNTV